MSGIYPTSSAGFLSGPRRIPMVSSVPNRRRSPLDRKMTVSEMVASRGHGPNDSNIIDPLTGKRYTMDEALALMPQGGYSINLGGSVGFSGRGGGSRGSSSGGGSRGTGYQEERPPAGPAPLARTAADYIRERGGMSTPLPSLLNEGYLNQPGVTQGTFDRLQSQKAMDQADPVAALYANKSQTATGPQAAFWQSMLQDQLARRTAEGAGGNVAADAAADAAAVDGATYEGGAPEYHAPGETRQDEQGNTWRWNEQAGRGEMVRTSFADAYAMRPPEGVPRGTFVAGEDLGEGQYFGPYGTASVTQNEVPTTFTNGHGSALGGVQFTGPQMGTQSAAEFFSDNADFSGRANKYAAPSPGYGGNPLKPNTPAWAAYDRAMKSKRLLGSR
jgi:hypothetical protein